MLWAVILASGSGGIVARTWTPAIVLLYFLFPFFMTFKSDIVSFFFRYYDYNECIDSSRTLPPVLGQACVVRHGGRYRRGCGTFESIISKASIARN